MPFGAIYYIKVMINSAMNTLALARSAVVTKLRFKKALSKATAVPIDADMTFPDENIMNGKVIADNTAYGI